jgi:hypothetical protein
MALKKKVPVAKKAAVSVKKTLPKKSRVSQSPVVSYQRIVIFTACIMLAVVATVLFNKPAVAQSVAGMSVARGLFAQATVDLPEIDGAIAFNIYYKEASENAYDHAVRNIPVGTSSYTISYLTKGTEYDHKIVAIDASGEEFWFSPTRPIVGVEGM